jgi:hypothetical protein
MSIQQWNILLNVVVGVLVVGYGIWLKNVVDQQIKAKDSTIETFKAIIEGKDADIARLQSDTAPAIAEQYSKMRSHADRMTADVADLQRIVDEKTKSMPSIRLLIEISLLVEIAQRMGDSVPTGHPKVQDYTKLFEDIYHLLKIKYEKFQELGHSSPEVQALWEEIRKALALWFESQTDPETDPETES